MMTLQTRIQSGFAPVLVETPFAHQANAFWGERICVAANFVDSAQKIVVTADSSSHINGVIITVNCAEVAREQFAIQINAPVIPIKGCRHFIPAPGQKQLAASNVQRRIRAIASEDQLVRARPGIVEGHMPAVAAIGIVADQSAPADR